MVCNEKRVIDVGCDHALLDIYLVKNYPQISCIASDINKTITENVAQTIANCHLEDRITVVTSDGVKTIDIEPDDVLVLSGMGTKTILSILKEKKTNRMIISTHKEWNLLRKEMVRQGYYIVDEKVVLERGIYYIIIDFQKGNVIYNDMELELGPILLKTKEEIVVSYFKETIIKNEQLIAVIPEQQPKKKQLEEINSFLKKEYFSNLG